jgi:hypothetical protein
MSPDPSPTPTTPAPDTPAVSFLDRLRIERVVWELDQHLYDLPRQSRIAKRREVRANLVTAAHEIGAKAAIGRLGSRRLLAAEYKDAEFGDAPRPSWWTASIFFLTGQLVLTSLLTEATLGFRDGIVTADPNASGTFHWAGVAYLQDNVTFTLTNGHAEWVGGAWTPLAWALWVGATVLVGRLWRAFPLWRRRRAATRMASAGAVPAPADH